MKADTVDPGHSDSQPMHARLGKTMASHFSTQSQQDPLWFRRKRYTRRVKFGPNREIEQVLDRHMPYERDKGSGQENNCFLRSSGS
jgi:hypothetical protein